jgi:hypothetical protein
MIRMHELLLAGLDAIEDDTSRESLLGAVVDASESAPRRIDGIVLLPLIGLHDDYGMLDAAQVGLAPALLAPVVGTSITASDVGRTAAVSFIGGDVRSPLILGLLAERATPVAEATDTVPERVVITAAQEIVLRCGDASLTLTHSGRVLLRGEHISSQSAGVHAIRGATVQIN